MNIFLRNIFFLGVLLWVLVVVSCNDNSVAKTSYTDKRNFGEIREINIGSQVWMAENLDVSTFSNGDSIVEAKSDEEWWAYSNSGTPAWCYFVKNTLDSGELTWKYYTNDSDDKKIAGRLYNWFAVNDSRGLAPAGWHVPSDLEWDSLVNYTGGRNVAWARLKSTTDWPEYECGTNSSGFEAIPNGMRGRNVSSETNRAVWWSSSVIENDVARSFTLGYQYNHVTYSRKGDGLSVRCVKDSPFRSQTKGSEQVNSRESNLTADESLSTKLREVKIGDQIWSTTNLDVACFKNGDSIPEAKTLSQWSAFGNAMEPVCCYYNFDISKGKIYGRLYNWYAIKDPRGLAPEGWHVPSNEEWRELANYLGEGAAIKMRSKGRNPKPGFAFIPASNSSNFSGPPGGTLIGGGSGRAYFEGDGGSCLFWSSSELNSRVAGRFELWDWIPDLRYSEVSGSMGCSVRCVRD